MIGWIIAAALLLSGATLIHDLTLTLAHLLGVSGLILGGIIIGILIVEQAETIP